MKNDTGNDLPIHVLVKKYGTPLYVYDKRVIEERCGQLKRYFPGVVMHYAVKANSNPALLAIIQKQGIGVETVSPGEIALAQEAGVKKEKISLTCANITESELRFAAKHAGHVHLDSLRQLEQWGRLKLGKDVSLRLNQGIGSGHHNHTITGGPDSKFGISQADVPAAINMAKKYGLRITGLQQHIGSGILNARVFLEGVRVLLVATKDFPDVTHIDFGGGLGIPYRPGEPAWDLQSLGKKFKALTDSFQKESGRSFEFAYEPGRFIVAEAGTLLVTVVDTKSTSAHVFVGVNSGFNHLIRPAMYDSYHEIENLSRPRGVKKAVSIAGNVCESGDLFATDRKIATPHIGDILAIRNAGAYGMSMASYYNMRALPKEVLFDGTRAKDISFDTGDFVKRHVSGN